MMIWHTYVLADVIQLVCVYKKNLKARCSGNTGVDARHTRTTNWMLAATTIIGQRRPLNNVSPE